MSVFQSHSWECGRLHLPGLTPMFLWSSARNLLRRRAIIATCMAAGALTAWLGFGNVTTAGPRAADLRLSALLQALLGARQWLNGLPLRPENVEGRIVLVDFWSFSCSNCLRALPHVREWVAKYHDRGRVVVGVQAPEFAFEKGLGNISKAVVALGVQYPGAVDNEFRIWNAFATDAWSALYFIGAVGKTSHQMQGEGDDGNSERQLHQPLSEAADTAVANSVVRVNGHGPQATADTRDLKSPEIFPGYAEPMRFASPGSIRKDAPKLNSSPATLSPNRWTLGGVWTLAGEFAVLNTAGGRISYRSDACDLHMVLGSASQGRPIRVRITIDGVPQPVDDESDEDADG